MKAIAFLTAIYVRVFSTFADPADPFENFSPHFSTNTQIIWEVPTNQLPQSFWIYKKLPRIFTAAAISNAIVLASFQAKGFPQPSTNPVVIWADRFKGEPEPPYFEITPDNGEMSYTLGDRAQDSERISGDEQAVQRAWDFLSKLGINQSELIKTNDLPAGAWGVFLPRQIDGIESFDQFEGVGFEQYAGQTKMRCFSIEMPNLKRYRKEATASDQQIIACIRASKTPVVANDDEHNYYGRIKSLGKAEKFTITKITPYYTEGTYGETNDPPVPLVTPLAEIDAVAEFRNSNMVVHLYSPITSSDIHRLLGK